MSDWPAIEKLILKEFNPSNITNRALDWITHPIENSQQADPFVTAIWFSLFYGALVYILGLVTRKYSWIDKSWSLLPMIYSWYYVSCIPTGQTDLASRFAVLLDKHPRSLLMAFLPTIWGLRLTFNFVRKGGYSWSGEDYRWKYLQSCRIFNTFFGKFLWEVFHFSFIAFYQSVMIMLFPIPAYVAYRRTITGKSDPLTPYDWALAVAWILLLTLETVADQQQWNYYARREKYQALSKTEQQSKKYASSDEARGFNTSGLFAYSRHPNVFAEQTMWVLYYLFSVIVTGHLINWTLVGLANLAQVIIGSLFFTEHISCSKYPAYKVYQKYVPMAIPSLRAKKIEWKMD